MSPPLPRISDPKVQAVWDALLDLMGSTYINAFASGNFDGTGTTMTMNCTDAQNNRWSYTEFTAGIRVTISPTNVSLGPGETQQFVASATNPDGTPVAAPAITWSVINGHGTISATGLYTAPATVPAATSETIRAAITGGTSWTSTSVSLRTA